MLLQSTVIHHKDSYLNDADKQIPWSPWQQGITLKKPFNLLHYWKHVISLLRKDWTDIQSRYTFYLREMLWATHIRWKQKPDLQVGERGPSSKTDKPERKRNITSNNKVSKQTRTRTDKIPNKRTFLNCINLGKLKPTTRSLLRRKNNHISQTCLSSKMTLAQVLYPIRCTNRPPDIGTSGTNTLGLIVHHTAADVIWSTAALSLTRICRKCNAIFSLNHYSLCIYVKEIKLKYSYCW